MPRQSLHILLVEDDAVDAEMIIRSFQGAESKRTITVARDGVEALGLLREQAREHGLTQPYLIITDIHMPRMNGIEFLRSLRQDPRLRQSVAFVLTSSSCEADKLAAYQQQVAGYVLKAGLTENLAALVELIKCYQEHVEFPP